MFKKKKPHIPFQNPGFTTAKQCSIGQKLAEAKENDSCMLQFLRLKI